MSKVILSTLVAALVSAAATAQAANGIASKTLNEMGLSSISMMSDRDALAIRGKGFTGCDFCGPRETISPSSRVNGNSMATIIVTACPDCVVIGGAAHSENAYAAEGPFAASGTNFSEAGAVISKSEVVDIGGVVKSVTNITSTRVFAGGFSTAMSF